MGWTAIDLGSERKRLVVGLGPYRESVVDAVERRGALVRQWRSTTAGRLWFLTLFAIMWNSILIPVIVGNLHAGTVSVDDHTHSSWVEALRHDPWIASLVVLPLVGFVALYHVVAIWVNYTRIDVGSETLTVRRGPLPWRGRFMQITASTIQQLHVQKYVSHEENEQPATAFRVMARLKDGRDIVIDCGMGAYADARALEQWIEKRLNIVDEPVAGEASAS